MKTTKQYSVKSPNHLYRYLGIIFPFMLLLLSMLIWEIHDVSMNEYRALNKKQHTKWIQGKRKKKCEGSKKQNKHTVVSMCVRVHVPIVFH